MDQHNGETNVQVIHFIDSCFPVFCFNFRLAVGYQDYLAGPCLLFGQILSLGLNSDDEGING